MTNPTPCVTDSDEWRFDAEPDEPDSPLTLVEQRLEWVCGVWKDAQETDTVDEWREVRLMFHGAFLALSSCADRLEDRVAYSLLQDVAYQHALVCISEGKYEGA